MTSRDGNNFVRGSDVLFKADFQVQEGPDFVVRRNICTVYADRRVEIDNNATRGELAEALVTLGQMYRDLYVKHAS